MTDTAQPVSALATFRGPVACGRTFNALILRGAAADAADDALILTFVGSGASEFPDSLADSLADAAVLDLGKRHYRITSGPRDWVVEATSVHLHRDIGNAFYRAIPPRAPPLTKRLFWRVVLGLAGTRAGKRLLLSLRGK